MLWILSSVLLFLAAVPTAAQEKGVSEEASSEEGEGEKPVLRPPELIEYIQAEYPKVAFDAGIEADVVAEIDIDENGLVVGVVIKEKAGHGFDEAAEDAIYRFVFNPATRNGKPIRAKILYRYRFFLEEAQEDKSKEEAAQAAPEELPVADVPKSSLIGTVLDMDGKAIVGATVVVAFMGEAIADAAEGEEAADAADEGSGPVVTDQAGKFTLEGIQSGTYQLDIVASGFKPLSLSEELKERESLEVTYRLGAEEALYETVVRGRRPAREVTRREVSRREITRIPGTGGDALRSVQYMPGMARAAFGGGALIVRGSSPEDSKYFFDSMPIPMLYHFGGLTSVINSDLLESIELYPGNFSVRYGGATGGVVEVFPRAPFTDRFHAYLDADFFDVGALVEGPIGKKWSVAASGRRSHIGELLNALVPDTEGSAGFTVAPRYYDYQLILDYHPRKRDNLRIFAFGSDDKMELVMGGDVAETPSASGDLNFRILFHQLQVNWTHRFNKGLSNSLNVGSGFVRSDTNFGTLFKIDLNNVPIYLRDEIAYDEKRTLALRIGLDMRFYWYNSKIRAPINTRMMEGEPADPLSADEEMAETGGRGWDVVPGLYSEFELRPVKNVQLIGGVRFDYFEGAKNPSLDPRLVARYKLFEPTTLKAGVGLFHQPPSGFTRDDKFGNPDLDLISAVHYSLGVEQEIIDNLDISLEGFYKNMSNMVVSDPATRYSNNGEGEVWGMEVMLKRHPTERFFGWISYTLMKSQRINLLEEDPEPRPFDSDQTHILTCVGSLVLGRGWEVGLTFRLVTGNPETPIVGTHLDSDSDTYIPHYGKTNSDRMPTFHQLDLRIDKNWKWKHIKAAVYLDIQNLYNQKNPEGYSYNFDYTERQFFNGLPIIPSLGLKLEH